MTEPQAFLECGCGACRIILCDPRVRFRTECLCHDCRQRLLIYSKRSGNAIPEEIASYQRGVDLLYFANALIVDDASRGRLEFAKLRGDAFNTTAWSTCCGTLMCGIHQAYEGATISVTPDICTVSPRSNMPTQFYLFSCDFPADKYEALPLRQAIPTVVSPYKEIDSPRMVALITAVRAPLAEQYPSIDYTTFEQLCAGQSITIDNSCFEESRAGKPLE